MNQTDFEIAKEKIEAGQSLRLTGIDSVGTRTIGSEAELRSFFRDCGYMDAKGNVAPPPDNPEADALRAQLEQAMAELSAANDEIATLKSNIEAADQEVETLKTELAAVQAAVAPTAVQTDANAAPQQDVAATDAQPAKAGK